jgi:hypothetical protein
LVWWFGGGVVVLGLGGCGHIVCMHIYTPNEYKHPPHTHMYAPPVLPGRLHVAGLVGRRHLPAQVLLVALGQVGGVLVLSFWG